MMVDRHKGNLKPELVGTVETRSRDSFTAAAGQTNQTMGGRAQEFFFVRRFLPERSPRRGDPTLPRPAVTDPSQKKQKNACKCDARNIKCV